MNLFRSLLFWIVLALLGALAAQFLLADPGYVLVRFRGTDYTTTVAAAVIGLLVAALVVGGIVGWYRGKMMRIKTGALPAGTYSVTWHVLSVDTHKTQGSFSFTIGR